jgi:hypothetical protein
MLPLVTGAAAGRLGTEALGLAGEASTHALIRDHLDTTP